MSEKLKALENARAMRSQQKRRAVEAAIAELHLRNEAITFSSIAELAKVSRAYLYNNFKDQISEERQDTRNERETIDGVVVPKRTHDEFRSIEASLRNKIDRLKAELGELRKENARLKTALEKERGTSEHYRQNWLNAHYKQNGGPPHE